MKRYFILFTACLSRRGVMLLLAALTVAVPIAASGGAVAPALFQTCAGCHGAQAQGNERLQAPALAGMEQAYLARQLAAFASGLRGSQDQYSQQMGTMKSLLNERSIAELSVYLANLSPLVAASGSSKLSVAEQRQGKMAYKYYQASCGGCHGARAEGNDAFSAPALNRLSVAYIKRQVEHFASLSRGSDSRYGRQMQMMAGVIEDPKIRDAVALHIVSFNQTIKHSTISKPVNKQP